MHPAFSVIFLTTLILGLLATIATFVLFICTAMIYASVKFLQEWYSPLTVANFTFLGIASGFMLAAAYSAYLGNQLVGFFGTLAVIATLMGLISRVWSMIRNGRIKYKSNVQTAIGVRHKALAQKAQGATGGSFNTREFFHGKGAGTVRAVRNLFIVLVFPVPVLLIGGLCVGSVSASGPDYMTYRGPHAESAAEADAPIDGLGRPYGPRSGANEVVPEPISSFLDGSTLDFNVRTYYLERSRDEDVDSLGWAIGGALEYRSGLWRDRFGIGATLYTSQPLYAPDQKPGSGLFTETEDGYTVLGEACVFFKPFGNPRA